MRARHGAVSRPRRGLGAASGGPMELALQRGAGGGGARRGAGRRRGARAGRRGAGAGRQPGGGATATPAPMPSCWPCARRRGRWARRGCRLHAGGDAGALPDVRRRRRAFPGRPAWCSAPTTRRAAASSTARACSTQPGCLHRPEVVGGVREQASAAALLRAFFARLRSRSQPGVQRRR